MTAAASHLLSSRDLDHLPMGPSYSAMKPAAAIAACSGPLLKRVWADDPAIDYIGRWDSSKTAKWAGSSLRFRFDGPLLFLLPGDKTCSTDCPSLGWQVDGKTYTARARKGVSIRLWPPEGTVHAPLPVTPNAEEPEQASEDVQRPALAHRGQGTSDNLNLSLSTGLFEASNDLTADQTTPKASSFFEAGQTSSPEPSASSSVSSSSSRLIEITLIDWGSALQIQHFEMLEGTNLTPAYPKGISKLPTLLFIGDSTTSGYLRAPARATIAKEYSGFLDAYPAQLRLLLAPGVRVSSVAYPGITLVDDISHEGMETKFFKAGPLEIDEFDNDWDFRDREDETAPTHIFVNIGTNDTAPTEKYLETLENFLNVLRETYGRRAGDILVMAPFGQYRENNGSEKTDGQAKAPYQTFFPGIRQKVEEIAQEWAIEDPLASGDFPETPILEYTKAQLDQSKPLSTPPAIRSRPSSRPNSVGSAAFATASENKPVPDLILPRSPSTGSVTQRRPALIVRPSSIAAVAPEERGTKTRLHFVDTQGWLEDKEDTYDGVHPTKKGARKIAKKLKLWLGEHGFLSEA